jgi:hypothetical protein
MSAETSRDGKRATGPGERLMTTICQYFTDKLGAAPADDTLRQLPISSDTSGHSSGSGDIRIWRTGAFRHRPQSDSTVSFVVPIDR